jgi:hypothetical protein
LGLGAWGRAPGHNFTVFAECDELTTINAVNPPIPDCTIQRLSISSVTMVNLYARPQMFLNRPGASAA